METMADTSDASGRTGLLLVRIWTEGGVPSAIRARITFTLDVNAEEHTTVVSSIEEVRDQVDAWLGHFSASGNAS